MFLTQVKEVLAYEGRKTLVGTETTLNTLIPSRAATNIPEKTLWNKDIVLLLGFSQVFNKFSSVSPRFC